jgi:chorismate dehydratase
MTLRVGCIPYLHAEPFYRDMQRRGLMLYELLPSAMAEALENGEIEAGLTPLVDCFRLQERCDAVAGFGIASMGQMSSVFLYSTMPIAELNGARIGITAEAITAPRLLDVLLRLRYHVQAAAYVSLDEPHDAFVLVGNQALCRRMGMPGFAHMYDLGFEWYTWTNLPCVLSRWLVRKDVAPQDVALLQDTLYVGLDDGVDAMFRIPEARDDLLMLPRDVTRYIRGFRYFIGAREQRAIDLFQQYLQQLEAMH